MLEGLLEDKKTEGVGRELEEVLGQLGKPMDQKGVELLGFVDLEKIAADLVRPDIGISQFSSFSLFQAFSCIYFYFYFYFSALLHHLRQKGKRRGKKSLLSLLIL